MKATASFDFDGTCLDCPFYDSIYRWCVYMTDTVLIDEMREREPDCPLCIEQD